jgi:segregation and condensation protein B
MEFSRLKAAVEALLYVSEGPLGLKRIREALGEDFGQADVREAVNSLVAEFESDGRGVRMAELAGGWQIITRPEYAAYVKRLQKIRPPKLSAQALETLAIIAYRQPIIRAEIEAIRGVNADGVIKTLMERRLIKMAGRQDVPGKPMMYATTQEFLIYFGLKDLSSLPSMRELERELGMEENPILSKLEPELPGLDGPEMEAMAAEYRARKAAQDEAEATAEAAQELLLQDVPEPDDAGAGLEQTGP